MSDEQTYDAARARNLEALLLALAERITELHERGELLRHAGPLMRLIGDVRSELFHYEVRATYDTPEAAERAAAAGVDLLLFATDSAPEAHARLTRALTTAKLDREEARASCVRVVELREGLG